MPRNYDIAELRRLDVAHHLPAQQDYALTLHYAGRLAEAKAAIEKAMELGLEMNHGHAPPPSLSTQKAEPKRE